MESAELRIFRAVAREGSITKAAAILGYVQSNVTARIQQLESEVGTALFYRQRGMILTPAGSKLLTYAEQILHLLDQAEKFMAETELPSGNLELGAYANISSLHLPKLLTQYYKSYPDVNLSLFTGEAECLLGKVLHYELDGAFVRLPEINDSNLVKELEITEELVIVSRPEYKNIKSLYAKPFLMNPSGCPNRSRLESWLKFQGISQVRYMDFNYLDSIIQGVLADLGVAFLPHSVVQNYEEKGLLKTFPVPPEFGSTKTFFIRHKDSLLTGALAKFIEMLKENNPLYTPSAANFEWSL
ncbi:LysR family transcriptional regulator [Paenibacillus lupini]|jgi:DNA-binding transcriptional LysR family regulator|uniref:LysR family transcriptional regulator n=1 Tax=Paenibacillus lupini TaxID=1450204 RepID=UPI00141F8D5F|nr:LysR family transcriptional regulator [Paenibacillus lupini]NIK23253.1 DNA-binding transcriptional LysR family regulator [Paenibacillus lupini]